MWNSGLNESMGGGFINSQNVDSPATKKKENVRRLQSVVPVALRMIQDCNEDDFKMFGMPVQIVSVIGILQSFEIESTKATYTIQDHTTSIKALWWLDSDGMDDTPKLPTVKEGSYVRIFGSIRTQEGEKTLMVLKMFPIDDCNLICTHMLEVIHTRLQAEIMSKDTAQIIKQNNPGANLANSMATFDENQVDSGQLNLTAMQMKVFKFLQANPTPAGPDRASILNSFPMNQRKEANEALEFLVNEGHAYSTIDNEHFKPTDL